MVRPIKIKNVTLPEIKINRNKMAEKIINFRCIEACCRWETGIENKLFNSIY
jgi:hypothetical protein